MSQCARVRMSGWTKMRNTSRSIWPGDKQSRQKNKTDFFFVICRLFVTCFSIRKKFVNNTSRFHSYFLVMGIQYLTRLTLFQLFEYPGKINGTK